MSVCQAARTGARQYRSRNGGAAEHNKHERREIARQPATQQQPTTCEHAWRTMRAPATTNTTARRVACERLCDCDIVAFIHHFTSKVYGRLRLGVGQGVNTSFHTVFLQNKLYSLVYVRHVVITWWAIGTRWASPYICINWSGYCVNTA